MQSNLFRRWLCTIPSRLNNGNCIGYGFVIEFLLTDVVSRRPLEMVGLVSMVASIPTCNPLINRCPCMYINYANHKNYLFYNTTWVNAYMVCSTEICFFFIDKIFVQDSSYNFNFIWGGTVYMLCCYLYTNKHTSTRDNLSIVVLTGTVSK